LCGHCASLGVNPRAAAALRRNLSTAFRHFARTAPRCNAIGPARARIAVAIDGHDFDVAAQVLAAALPR